MSAHLQPTDFPDWTTYYWEYQHRLAAEYLLPCLQEWGMWRPNLRVLDVGCGDGGASCALAEAGAQVEAIELEPRRLDGARQRAAARNLSVRFKQADITKPDTLLGLAGPFDLVMFRDVLEHIPDRIAALEQSREWLADGGGVLVIFPPYLSAYGGHQQLLHPPRRFGLRWARLPWAHCLPEGMFRAFSRTADGNDDPEWGEIERIRRARLTLRGMQQTAGRAQLKLAHQRLYLLRPSFRLRYGTPVVKAGVVGRLPGLRELFVTGAYQLYGAGVGLYRM